jgi:deoxyribonuclease V
VPDLLTAHPSLNPASVDEAIRQQEALRGRVVLTRTWTEVSILGAVDCAYAAGGRSGRAAIVLYRYPQLIELSHVVVEHPVRFPYIPGLLAFRELPLILAAVESLSQWPDLFLVDGQGIAHPRRLGIASHLGVVLDRPTIGCAKSVLVGQARPPGWRVGSWTPLRHRGEVVGALLRTRTGVRPMVVSPGHRVDLDTSLEIVRRCCDGFRLPMPLRRADLLSKNGDRSIFSTECRINRNVPIFQRAGKIETSPFFDGTN